MYLRKEDDPIKKALAHKRQFGALPDEHTFPFDKCGDGCRPYEGINGARLRIQADYNLRRGGAFAAQGAERD